MTVCGSRLSWLRSLARNILNRRAGEADYDGVYSFVGGKTETGKKVPVGTSGDSFTLQIEISPEQIAVRDAQGRELDRYHRPDRNETVGRFGFKGDVWLAIKKAP